MKIPSAALLVILTTTARSFSFTPSVSSTRNRNVAVSFLTTCHESSHHEQDSRDTKRRTLLDSLRGAVNALPFIGKADAASSAVTSEMGGPIADFPMRRLQLPQGGLGRSYIIIQLYIDNTGPYDFMVDSGLTTELITPHLQSILHLKNVGITKQGLSAGEVGKTQSLVELNNASLCCNSIGQEDKFPLPPLTAIVTDFPQEHMDPRHDPVEGMLGMELLDLFDVDFDFPKNRLRLWRPGSAAEAIPGTDQMVAIDTLVVNETRLLGFRVASSESTSNKEGEAVMTQPYLGLVDCGSSFSIVNWSAASCLGLPPKGDTIYQTNPAVQGMGVDGRPQVLPTTLSSLSFVGNPIETSSQMMFKSPPTIWKPWDPISIAVGDLPVFSQLLGDGRTPYKGPAGIIGLDILSQRRVILETNSGRKRRIYVGNA